VSWDASGQTVAVVENACLGPSGSQEGHIMSHVRKLSRTWRWARDCPVLDMFWVRGVFCVRCLARGLRDKLAEKV